MRPRNWRKHALLTGKACMDCGHGDWRVLHFHHRDPSTKAFIIERALDAPGKYPTEVLLAELDKCDVVCANCHMLRHTNLPEVPCSS